jgi:hypothetical protein
MHQKNQEQHFDSGQTPTMSAQSPTSDFKGCPTDGQSRGQDEFKAWPLKVRPSR